MDLTSEIITFKADDFDELSEDIAEYFYGKTYDIITCNYSTVKLGTWDAPYGESIQYTCIIFYKE